MLPSPFDSLVSVASTKPDFVAGRRTTESDQEYLHRLATAISEVADDAWNSLTEAAKQWYDSCIGEDNDLRAELTVPDGYATAPAPARRRVVAAPKRSVFDLVLAEVCKTTPDFAPRHEKETDQAFLARIVRELPAAIVADIQEWVASADAALEASKPIPLPDGYVATDKPTKPVRRAEKPAQAQVTAPAPAPAVEAAPAEEEEACPVPAPTAPKTSNGSTDHRYSTPDGNPLTGLSLYNAKLAAGEVSRRKGATKPMVVKETTERGRLSTTGLIRDAVTKNPNISIEELTTLLQTAGKPAAPTTITTTRASHLAALRAIQRAGWTPPNGQAIAAE